VSLKHTDSFCTRTCVSQSHLLLHAGSREQSIVMSMSVSCLYVCLSISHQPHYVWTSLILPVAVVWPFSGCIAIRYVLPIFLDNVIVSYNGSSDGMSLPQQPCCSFVHGLTPYCVVLIVSYPRRWWVPRVLYAMDGVLYAMQQCLVELCSCCCCC